MAQPVRPMSNMRILYLIFDLNQTIWLHAMHMYCMLILYIYIALKALYIFM